MSLRSCPFVRSVFLFAVCSLLLSVLPRNGRAEVVITPQEQWTNVFAGEKIALHFAVAAKDAFQGRVVWTFAATNGRVFPGGRGEAFVKLKAGESTKVKVPLQMPPLKAGVVLAGIVKVSAPKKGQSEPEGSFDRKLWIFFNDAFVDRKQWLKKLEITVYDPTKDAKSVKLLEKLDIPHKEIRNPAALAKLDKGLLLIGEGVSFRDERGLDDIITKLAKRGLPVLCLAPQEGMIALPGTAESGSLPNQLHWRKQDIITELDKRLDSAAWHGAKSVIASSLVIKAEGGKVVGEVTTKATDWPWLEADYANNGKLVVLGFPVIAAWESSPTPRYLLARLLEHVTKRSEEAQEKRSNHP